MRDLYYRLGLSPDTDDEEILAKAIAEAEPSIREDAAYVIGNPARRAVYDRTHRVLSQIAELRLSFGDTLSGVNWTGCDDFVVSASERLRRRTSPPKETRSLPVWLPRLVVFVVLIVVGIALAWPFLGSVPHWFSSDTDLQFSEQQVPLPATKILKGPVGQSLAPFRIVARDANRHYYVKVVRPGTGSVVVAAFVRGGETLNAQVPLGFYMLRYASGREWYGPEHLFGPETAYFETSSPFNFRFIDKGVAGYDIELIPQGGGYLGVNRLDAEEF
jgi:hypothetical protein